MPRRSKKRTSDNVLDQLEAGIQEVDREIEELRDLSGYTRSNVHQRPLHFTEQRPMGTPSNSTPNHPDVDINCFRRDSELIRTSVDRTRQWLPFADDDFLARAPAGKHKSGIFSKPQDNVVRPTLWPNNVVVDVMPSTQNSDYDSMSFDNFLAGYLAIITHVSPLVSDEEKKRRIIHLKDLPTSPANTSSHTMQN